MGLVAGHYGQLLAFRPFRPKAVDRSSCRLLAESQGEIIWFCGRQFVFNWSILKREFLASIREVCLFLIKRNVLFNEIQVTNFIELHKKSFLRQKVIINDK